MATPNLDFLIIGQGLAGSFLAWNLVWKNQQVVVVDRDAESSCSKNAAGILNPMTGQQFALSWKIDQVMGEAKRFYSRVEKETGRKLFHPAPIVRLFADANQRNKWLRRSANQDYMPWVTAPQPVPLCAAQLYHNEFGGIELQGGGWLDTKAFLRATREMLESRDAFRRDEFCEKNLELEKDGVRWQDLTARRLAMCQGYEAARSRVFDFVLFRCAKGDILEIEIEGLERERILNRGNWIVPVGGNRYLAGATYIWDRMDEEVTVEGRLQVEMNLRTLIRRENWKVIDHRVGVRPVIRHSKALIGKHPEDPRLSFFNGLGSKGSLNGPWFARCLAEHLVEGISIPRELDLGEITARAATGKAARS